MPMQPKMQKIAVGADHGGYELKELIKTHLEQGGLSVTDCGTGSTESVDYPKFAQAVASAVATGRADGGIMVDRAGIGSTMAPGPVTARRRRLHRSRPRAT